MADRMTAESAFDTEAAPNKSPEEKLLEAIFGRRPRRSDRISQTITPDTADEEFAVILNSLDRSETRLRLLQNQMWGNRREIDEGLGRIRSTNDRIAADLSALTSNG